MSHSKRCNHCRCFYRPNPRVKNQKYCNKKLCQRYRKTLWQQVKMRTDPDYRANQRDCQRSWYKRHPDYWRHYRKKHPIYTHQNRLLQRVRNSIRHRVDNIAKMDALKPVSSLNPGTYYLISTPNKMIAKMDTLIQKVHIIPAC